MGRPPARIALDPPEGTLPPGGRHAGLTAHWFSRGVVGQRQQVHTGWLEVSPDAPTASYAPHTRAAYRMPPSRLVYRIAAGLVTRLRYRQADGDPRGATRLRFSGGACCR